MVALLTKEANFVAVAAYARQCVWMQRISEHLSIIQVQVNTILCDDSLTIKLSMNLVLHGKIKHIDIRFHFMRNLMNDKIIDIVYYWTKDQIADIVKRPLKLEAFMKLRAKLGVCDELNWLLVQSIITLGEALLG